MFIGAVMRLFLSFALISSDSALPTYLATAGATDQAQMKESRREKKHHSEPAETNPAKLADLPWDTVSSCSRVLYTEENVQIDLFVYAVLAPNDETLQQCTEYKSRVNSTWNAFQLHTVKDTSTSSSSVHSSTRWAASSSDVLKHRCRTFSPRPATSVKYWVRESPEQPCLAAGTSVRRRFKFWAPLRLRATWTAVCIIPNISHGTSFEGTSKSPTSKGALLPW